MEVQECEIVCPFDLDEIAVFESVFRREIYIGRINQTHIDYFGAVWIPNIRKATLEEKRKWFESGKFELVIGVLRADDYLFL